MAQPLIHIDAYYLDQAVGENILGQNAFPLWTDAQLVAATSIEDLKTAIDNYAGHSETQGFKAGVKRALDVGKADGSCSDTNVQAATTAATLAANTYADPGKLWPLFL
jgi:hypothetical protein